MPEGVVEKQLDRAAVWTFQEAEAVGGSEVDGGIHFLLRHTSGCTFLRRKCLDL